MYLSIHESKGLEGEENKSTSLTSPRTFVPSFPNPQLQAPHLPYSRFCLSSWRRQASNFLKRTRTLTFPPRQRTFPKARALGRAVNYDDSGDQTVLRPEFLRSSEPVDVTVSPTSYPLRRLFRYPTLPLGRTAWPHPELEVQLFFVSHVVAFIFENVYVVVNARVMVHEYFSFNVFSLW